MIDELRAELTDDPLGRGYTGMTDEQAATSLNSADRTRFRQSIPNREIFAGLDLTEFKALSPEERAAFSLVMQMDAIDATDPNTRSVLGAIFPAGSNTRTKMMTVAQETISRGVELGLGTVRVGQVEEARRGD